jgi:uncharacterized protein YdbL (DUF1318 family)
MKKVTKIYLLALMVFGFISQTFAAADLEVNTPAIAALKKSMQDRHGQLAPHYASGAVGLTREGHIQLRDANAIPLAQRQSVSSLVAAENQDRSALYREIARANNNPGWEKDIRETFAQRWVEKAQSGWWYQNAKGDWVKK